MMKALLYNAISWAIGQSALALICYLIYDFSLVELTKVDINFIQWLSIIVIAACVMPEGKLFKTKDDQPGAKSKIDEFVTSIINKHDER